MVVYGGSQLYDYSSVVAGDYLYIDGGMIGTMARNAPQFPPNHLTLSISLSESFTGDALPVQSIAHPSAFQSTKTFIPALWSKDESSFFSWGGHDRLETVVENDVWKFSADGQGSGTWSYTGTSSPVLKTIGMAMTSMNDIVYIMGSRSDGQLTAFGWKTEAWTYIDLPASVSKSGANVVSLPDYGPEGTLMFLGGDGKSFDNISLFDAATQHWYTQPATGDAPSERAYFGVAGARSVDETFEILVHSGIKPESMIDPMSDAYVLTLPAFKWFKLSGEYENRNIVGESTCEHIGGGQIILLDAFPWDGKPTSGVETFGSASLLQAGFVDLKTLSFESGYNANYGDYELSSTIAKYYEDLDPDNLDWGSAEVKDLFMGKASLTPRFWAKSNSVQQGSANETTSKVSSAASSDSNSSPPIIGIVGGVIGGIAGLIIIAVIIHQLWRRRPRQQQRPQETFESGESSERFEKPELDGAEMSTSAAAGVQEVDGKPLTQVSTRSQPMELESPVNQQESDLAIQRVEVEGSVARYELDGETTVQGRPPAPPRRADSNGELYE